MFSYSAVDLGLEVYSLSGQVYVKSHDDMVDHGSMDQSITTQYIAVTERIKLPEKRPKDTMA